MMMMMMVMVMMMMMMMVIDSGGEGGASSLCGAEEKPCSGNITMRRELHLIINFNFTK